MEKEFVPYELSVKLKDLGFDEPCFARFRKGNFHLNTLGKPHRYNSDEIVKGDVSAPLWQQAFDWFMEMGYESEINRNIPEMESKGFKKYSFYIWSENDNPRGNYTDRKQNSTDTYPEARQSCLEKLIEIAQGD